MNNDDQIIHQRIAGRSVRAIAKGLGATVTQVNEVIARWMKRRLTAKPGDTLHVFLEK